MRTQARTQHTDSTRPTRPTAGSLALANAQRTFEPTNTNPTPAVFADEWAAGD